MTKLEWFLAAAKYGRYKQKHWIMRCFSLSRGVSNRVRRKKAWDIKYVPGESAKSMPAGVNFYDGEGALVTLSDYTYNPKKPEPPFKFKEGVDLVPGDVANLNAKVRTTYGNIVANYMVLVYPFRSILPFRVGRFSLRDVEKDIEKLLTTNPDDMEAPRDPNIMYVVDYLKYTRGAGMLAGISHLCVPSATEKSMTTHPDMDKLKKKLLEQYKGRLHDPVVIAAIEKELVALDTEYLKGDLSEGFLLSKKSRNVIRKKSHILVGLITAFDESGKGELVPRSLADGVIAEDLVAMANDTREGSYDRGADTALGGYEVKQMLNITQNTVIVGEDCGTKLTFPMTISKDNMDTLNGSYAQVGKELVLLDPDTIGKYLGTTLNVRTPYFCRQTKSNICKVCVGAMYASRPTSLPSAISSIGSAFMSIFMASMHAKVLETAVYDPDVHII